MQFLKVWAKERGSDTIFNNIPVLINGCPNGLTGNPIKLDEGVVEVSVDFYKANTMTVTLVNTTVENPMEVMIMVGDHDMLSPDIGLGGLNA